MGTSPDAPEMGFDVVVGDVPTVPPAWALWQRHLIRSPDYRSPRRGDDPA